MTELNGLEAAWQAAQSLRDVLMLLNATDIDDEGNNYRGLPWRLAASGPGTAWEGTETALRVVLSALLAEDTPAGTTTAERVRAVIDELYNSGESVKWTVGVLRREEREAAVYVAAEAAAEAAEELRWATES